MTELTGAERVKAAINLQKIDRVPVCVSLNYFVARHKGIKIAEFMQNTKLQKKASRETFEELGGFDYPQFSPPDMFDTMNTFFFLPVKVKLPGIDLPDDVIPQFDETELIQVEDYDKIIKMGWRKFVENELLPKAFPGKTRKPPAPITVDEEDKRFWESKKVYMPTGIMPPPITLPYEVFSYGRSMEKFSVDLYRRGDKILEATEAVFDELMGCTFDMIKPEPGKAPGSITIAANRFSNGFISPKQFEKFAFPYLKKAVEMGVSRGFGVYFHFDQSWTRFLPYFREFPEGRYVYHFDGLTDMFKAKEVIGDRMCIMGDIPATMFKLGTPQEVAAYTRKLIDVVGKGSGFILSPGCGLPDDAKFENVKAMIDTAKNYWPH